MDSEDSSCSSSLDEETPQAPIGKDKTITIKKTSIQRSQLSRNSSITVESRNSIASVKNPKKRKLPKVDISLNDTAGREDEEDRFESSSI